MKHESRTGDHALLLGSNLGERTNRKVNGVAVDTGGAVISDGHCDRLAVLGVGDLDLLSAQGRFVARVAVAILINGSDEGRVRVDLAASTSDAILEEESSTKQYT